MKTFAPSANDITRDWHFFDAKGQVLGRLATQIAVLLMSKHKPAFARNLDSGDHVVVVNVDKVVVTGNKAVQKLYHRHSGYPGGFKTQTYAQVQAVHPDRILLHAVSGMLPDNKLKARMLKHLHVYSGSTHPYVKQFKQPN